MSASPTNMNTGVPGSVAVPVKERRQIHRMDVSLRLRIRPADSSSQDFEDVQVTLNASRKAFYFFTALDGYELGMRVIVARMYGGNGQEVWEDRGQVIRVHRREAGFGVVVQLETPSHLAKSEPVQREGQQMPERRRARRKQFIAEAEVIDVRSATRMRGRVSDLSLRGCYVDTLNPFPVGSTARLQIFQDRQILDALASVASCHPGSGMGLAFGDMTEEQRLMVQNWLTGAPAAVESQVPTGRGPASSPPRVQTQQSYVARLVHMLVRKGVLSRSEAMDLLGGESER